MPQHTRTVFWGRPRRRPLQRYSPRPAPAPERAVLAVPAEVRVEHPSLDRMEDLRDQPEEPPVVPYSEARIPVTCQCQTPPNSPAHRPPPVGRPRRKFVRLDRLSAWVLVSRLKVRFLHGSPTNPGGYGPRDSWFSASSNHPAIIRISFPRRVRGTVGALPGSRFTGGR
jgi:hypothetical protein